jgi:hypothetical protein
MNSLTRKPYATRHAPPPKRPDQYTRDFTKCPRCFSPTKRSTAWNGGESEFWWQCTRCNTYINTYIPQTHQAAFHEDTHIVRGNFGGYGSGKTLTSRQEFYKHLFLTPKGTGLIGANVTSQYEQTIKRDIEADLPVEFFSGYSVQKAQYDFVNGYRLMFRPFDDPDKLRSINLDFALVLEASETKRETFSQLRTRLRNKAAINGQHDWRKLITESNPDPGWVRVDMLNNADYVKQSGSLQEEYPKSQTPDESISCHVTSTDANIYLPKNFVRENAINKPPWWVARYLYGSFNFSDGLVYPSAMKHVVEYFEPEKSWPRLLAFDYGLSDPSHFLLAAIDPVESVLYFYKEARATDQNLDTLAEIYFSLVKDIPNGGFYTMPLIDPKSGPKRGYDKNSLIGLFLQKGIYFQPGAIAVDPRIYRFNTYIESGRCKIMDSCPIFIKELKEYKFKPRTLDNDTSAHKPIDARNHAVNCGEWIVMALPDKPSEINIGVYNKYGRDVTDKDFLPGALESQDDIYGMLGRELWS